MPHVALVAMAGFRVREREMLALGMSLPGLAQRAGAVGALPSLGLLTLAGMTPGEWSVSLHEAPSPCNGSSQLALVNEIARQRPTLVAISTMTASVLGAYALADLLRASGMQVVLGGLHASTMSQEAALHADAVVIGEGEPTWLHVLADAQRRELRPTYRSDELFDLAKSPQPRLELLAGSARPRFTLQTSRGCPFACEFCGASRLLGAFREKPVAQVERELAAIVAKQPRAHIELADDNTFAGKRDASELLAAFERAGVRWFTECDWRIGERPELLAKLAHSGCVQVLVGVESLMMNFSGMGAKRAPLPRVMDALMRVQEAGIAVIGCFVVGGDDDTLESIHALGDAPFADVQLTVQTPFPGTALREKLEKSGRILADRSWDACTLFDVAYQPAQMSVADLERAFRNVVAMVHAKEPSSKRNELRQTIWAKRYGVTR
jgi:radical SAM superfamily enzyme YgiQ (UPF0313 family)